MDLAAAEHHRIGRQLASVSRREATSSPSGALCRCTADRSSKSTPIMPVPTAQPQRVAVSAAGLMPASRIAWSAAASAKRCERFANLRSLRSPMASSRKPLTSAAMRVGKPLASNMRDRRAAAASGEQRVPRRGDVVADRRDEADAGDRDAAAVHGSLRSARAASSAAVGALRIARDAAQRRHHPAFGARGERRYGDVAVRCRELGADLEHAARRRERAHLDVRHAQRRSIAPFGERGASARERRARGGSARRAAASPETPGGAENGRRRTARPRARRACAVADRPGTRCCGTTRGAATPRKRPGSAPGAAQQREALRRSASGASNSLTGSIGPRQSMSSMTRAPPTSAQPLIRDGFVVAAVDLDREVERVAGLHVAVESRLVARARRPGGRETRCAPSRPMRRAGRPPRRRGTTGSRGRSRGHGESARARALPARTP